MRRAAIVHVHAPYLQQIEVFSMAIPHNFTAVRDIVEQYLVVNVQLMGNTDVVALLRKNH
jgi:hypothetical protein